MKAKELLEEIKRIKTISDIGLLYSTNEFEKERHLELQDICFRLMEKISDRSMEDLKISLAPARDYPTVKVDIRGLILSPDNKILLVKESSDGRWSLPGGWAEIGNSPAETITRECKEETGLDVRVKSLLAVFDKRKHSHPPQLAYVYKMLFYCEALSTELNKGFDVLDVQYFSVDDLPELSEGRILKSQLLLAFNKIIRGDKEAYFD